LQLRAPASIAILAALVMLACGGAPRVVAPGRDGDFAPAITDAATWDGLAAHAGREVFSRVEVVKTVLDRDNGKLYFLQSRRWPIHFDFASRFLARPYDPVIDQRLFNERQYHEPDRRFVLGSLTRYLDQDRWTFELGATDTLDIETTLRVFATIRGAVFFGDKLHYRPVPASHQVAVEQLRALVPVFTTEELFANLAYQPIETGEAWGYLRIIPAGAPLPTDLHPYDVVVLGTQPLELPVVAAIVTDELQAPLGHLAVLAHSRGTPDVAVRGASTRADFVALDGKPVHLRALATDVTLTAATTEELAHVARARHGKAPAVRLDGKPAGMPLLAELDDDDLARFGAKTTQLAKVARIGGIATPRAFGLPFETYLRFLAANGLDRRVAALLGNDALRHDPQRLRQALDELRAAIVRAPVPPALTDAVIARIGVTLRGSAKVRLRSSTNAEDLAGFSGAGLYQSTRVDPGNRADVERGLREVWASVWGWEAFVERDWYGIDHKKVAMAILVQESIDDDLVNGVAITGNPYFEGRPAVYINAQQRGGSVTGAAGGEVPEQVLYYTYDTGKGLERISDSSRSPGVHLLADAEVQRFARQLEKIHREFTDEDVGTAQAVDVEFLIRPDRSIVVVQARPYRMRWTGDRRRPSR
jgi:hypothetical protein